MGGSTKVALVTGASRGIGAAVVSIFASHHVDLVINYRSKQPRAEEVAHQVRAMGARAVICCADLTDANAVSRMASETKAAFGGLDYLVLNASGGMEKDMPLSYPMDLNLHAQLRTVDAFLPLMHAGACIVFVTSHVAHFYGRQPVAEAYEAVAASKKAGETVMLARIPELAEKGLRLVIVSGDMIEGTITAKLLDRVYPELRVERRRCKRVLPSIEVFAAAIVAAAEDASLPSGYVKYVGDVENRSGLRPV